VASRSLQRLFSSQRVVAVSVPEPIIVVGAGTAGCTVVSYLANNTNHPIVVIEPGGFGDDDDPQFLNLADTDLLTTSGDGYVQARAMGGGSAVNGLLLTGNEPEHLRGLTRMAQQDDIGSVGESLLALGGRFSRLWWNGGRWNPGRAVRHLMEEKRVSRLQRSVISLLLDGGRVVGVECSEGPLRASAVVLCAGAIASPGILLVSGVQKLNPMIGVGLQNHPTITAQFSLSAQQSARFDAAVVREWSTPDGGVFMNVAYERVAKNLDGIGALSVSLMNPISRGHVEISSHQLAHADFQYVAAEEDLIHMVVGVRDLIRLLTEGNFTNDPGSISVEGLPLGEMIGWNDEELAKWLRQSVRGVSHAASSCAQAVDSSGRVLGLENCWIADASVLAHVPTETPAAPVTMEALRIARTIGESLS
jgi:choline dehydrogenase-like flavoprotein